MSGFLKNKKFNENVASGFQKEGQMMDGVKEFGRSLAEGAGKATAKMDSSLGKNFSRNLGIFGTGLIVSQFIEEGIKSIKSQNIKRKAPKYFKKLLEKHPQLLEEDPEEVAMLWETFYNTAPTAAKDHTMAAAFIKQNIDREVVKDHGGPPLDTYKLLSDIEGKRKDHEPDPGQFVNTFLKMLDSKD